jgi:hypothetical protein
MIHQRSTTNKSSSSLIIEDELRRHELTGLAWVLVSPAIAGFSLQYSRFLFSNYDKYMSSFNVTVFVLAASVRPLIHVIDLLRERTALLQSEITINETEMEQLSTKLYHLEGELHNLRASFATKRDLGQVNIYIM